MTALFFSGYDDQLDPGIEEMLITQAVAIDDRRQPILHLRPHFDMKAMEGKAGHKGRGHVELGFIDLIALLGVNARLGIIQQRICAHEAGQGESAFQEQRQQMALVDLPLQVQGQLQKIIPVGVGLPVAGGVNGGAWNGGQGSRVYKRGGRLHVRIHLLADSDAAGIIMKRHSCIEDPPVGNRFLQINTTGERGVRPNV